MEKKKDKKSPEFGAGSLDRNVIPCLPSFRGAELLGSPWPLLPKVTGDGESVHAHGHGFGRDGGELFPIRAVLVNGLDHLGDNDPWADAGEAHHLLRLRVHGVNSSELAAGVSEEDEEVVGRALLHFLPEKERKRSKRWQRRAAQDGPNSAGLWHGHPAYLYNLVFLGFIDLAGQAAAGDSVMDDELVGLKTWLLVQLWTCVTCHFSRVPTLSLMHRVCWNCANGKASSTDLCILELRRGRK